jgi:hypothetical protein
VFVRSELLLLLFGGVLANLLKEEPLNLFVFSTDFVFILIVFLFFEEGVPYPSIVELAVVFFVILESDLFLIRFFVGLIALIF